MTATTLTTMVMLPFRSQMILALPMMWLTTTYQWVEFMPVFEILPLNRQAA